MSFRFPDWSNDPLLRREMRGRWRRPLTFLALFLFAAAFCVVTHNLYETAFIGASGTFEYGPGNASGAATIGERLMQGFLLWQSGLATLMALLVGAPALAAERERGTLTDLLLANIAPEELVNAKFWGLLSLLGAALLVPLPAATLCFFLGGVSVFGFVTSQLLILVMSLIALTTGLMVSASNASVSAATTQCLFLAIIGVPVAVGLAIISLETPEVMLMLGLLISPLVLGMLAAARETFRVTALTAVREGDVSRPRPLLAAPPAPSPVASSNLGPSPTVVPSNSPSNARSVWSADVAVLEKASPQEPRVPERGFAANIVAAEATPRGQKLLSWAERDPFALRDLRVHLRRTPADSIPLFWLHPVALLVLIVVFAGLGLIARLVPEFADLWKLGTLATVFGAGALASVVAATSFTRERGQKMMEAVILTGLSPLRIVGGKIYVAFLRVVCVFGPAAIFTAAMAFVLDVRLLLIFTIWLGTTLTFCTVSGLWFSLSCRRAEVATLGALAFPFLIFCFVPYFVVGTRGLVKFPVWLDRWWADPIARFFTSDDRSEVLALTLYIGGASLLGTSVLLILLLWQARQWRDESAGESFWSRDLTKVMG